MANATPQLKRKRESAGAPLKNLKKQRKSEAGTGVGADAENGSPTTTPVAQSTSQLPKAGTTPETLQSNGVHEDAHVSTSSNSNHVKQESHDPPNGAVDHSDAEDVPLNVARKESRRQEKRERKHKKKIRDLVLNGVDKETAAVKVKSLTKKKKPKDKTPEAWSTSSPQGGWFLPSDPIFSADEKVLILANLKSLQIYSTETSVLVSTLPLGGSGVLTAYALSPTTPNHVYVASSKGDITLWDYVDGTEVDRWNISATVQNIAVITLPGVEEHLVYCHEAGDSHILNVQALPIKSDASKTASKHILTSKSAIRSFQVLLRGKYVVVVTSDSVTIGKRLKPNRTALQDVEYVWRELKFSKRVTTCDAYIRQAEIADKSKRSATAQRDVIDLAVGDEYGVILLFEDMLASFAAMENFKKTSDGHSDDAESLRPKRLHWHRDAVGSVKWSLDGNYVISGGDETVLTIWQLATGKPQHLPHLTAAIENIVVSPTGSSYALSLANNSVIVLSTTELDARTNIIGIQTRRIDPERLFKASASGTYRTFQPVPMAIDPKSTKDLLFSVPSSQPRRKSEDVQPEPYLQTFDFANHRSVSRQALTRNNATDPNIAPDGRRILEPSVTNLQISHDGQWLATIDEWIPPINEGMSDIDEEERLLRREVYLKFWRRDEKTGQWVLESRVDSPHLLEDACAHARIFDLIADPTRHGFATIGEDAFVKIWRPKTRLRDGIVVRGAGDGGLINWSLSRSLQLPKPWVPEATVNLVETLPCRTSKLAFSADGSVLAAAVSGISASDSGAIHLLDVFSATIQSTMTEIDVTVLCGIGIIGRYLVIITDSINVWDMVSSSYAYSIPINTHRIDEFQRPFVVRLAVNESDDTFAVALPRLESKSSRVKAKSRISVFSTEQEEPLWSESIPGVIMGLVARRGEKGYIALDSASCVRNMTPTVSALTLPTLSSEEKSLRRVEQIEEAVEDDNNIEDEAIVAVESLDADYDRPLVTHQNLEELFHTDNVLPPPKELFHSLIGLFGGKKASAQV